MAKIPIYQPSLNGNEKKYVAECLQSNWISSKGKFVSEFEQKFAQYNNAHYASSTCNGTCALHIALLALGIGKGDEVIVPTLTYIATVNAITYTGAKPIFVDSLIDTWQMSPQEVQRKISLKTKAILAVHLYGHSCDMDALLSIADQHNLFIIEDCAEALGSKYKEKSVGTFGDVAIFSFYGNKTITTGEGGMVITNNQKLHEKIKKLKGQGLAKNGEYWHDAIGYNYRMTNICAAIGLAQLEQIDTILRKKHALAEIYKQQLQNIPVTIHQETKGIHHSYWMVSLLAKNKKQRDQLRHALTKNGIETRPVFHPIHTMPMYSQREESFPVAKTLSERGINLPSWPELGKELSYVCKIIANFFKEKEIVHPPSNEVQDNASKAA